MTSLVEEQMPTSYGDLTDEHRKAIGEHRTPPKDVKVHHPTKNVEYVPWPITAQALDEVFGIGGWRMQLYEAVETNAGKPELTWKGWLVAYGYPVWATGSGQLGHMGWSDAYQSAESRAMSKAAARLGIFRDAWLKEDATAIDAEAKPAKRRAPVKPRQQPQEPASAAPPIGAYESAHESARLRQAEQEIQRSSKEQHGFIRSLLARMFPDDDQAQVGCIASINEHAVNDAATEIHLTPLAKGEASAMIDALQKMQQAVPQPKLAAVGADPEPARDA